MALGFVLSWLAALGRRPVAVWLSLSTRLVLFAVVVAGLARDYGPAAGLCVLVAAVLTRGLIARKSATATR